MTPRKWDVAWASLDPATGHEQAGKRPVLIFCNDRIAASILLVAVLPMTTLRRGRKVYPTEVMVPSGQAGLAVDSLVLCHQIRTVSLQRLSAPTGSIGEPAMRSAIEAALGLWLDA